MKKGLPGETRKGVGGARAGGGAEVAEGRSVATARLLPHPTGPLSASYTSVTVCLEMRERAWCCWHHPVVGHNFQARCAPCVPGGFCISRAGPCGRTTGCE